MSCAYLVHRRNPRKPLTAKPFDRVPHDPLAAAFANPASPVHTCAAVPLGERKAMDCPGIVTTIRRLALEAGAEILQVYGSEDFAVRAKSDASPITRTISRSFLERFPKAAP